MTSSRSPPTRALSSSDVPSAITTPWSITAIRSASLSASSSVWVVSSTVVPAATRRLDRLEQRRAAAGVEAGGGLVEEEHRRADHERGRQVEPAAHAAGVGAHQPRARLVELEALEQLVRTLARALAAQVVEAADHLEVLEAGQVLVDRGVLTGQADAGCRSAAASLTTSSPATRALPASGRSSVVRIAHGRGLAGPVRAEQAEHGAGLARGGPLRAAPRTLPYDLRRSVASIPNSSDIRPS